MIRNRVKRRLRAIMSTRLHDLPDGAAVVIRALPPAADAPFEDRASAVDGALRHALAKATR